MTSIKRIALISAALFVAGMVCNVSASAQATRTWVSGTGDDNNPCSRTLPCKSFGNTIAKTAAGGEINCLDPGGFGAVTITKSISIICDDVFGNVMVMGTNGIIINVPAGSYVTLSGFSLDGLGNSGNPGMHGIYIFQGGNISLRNMTITGFREGYGVNFVPTATSKLTMSNVTLTENGTTDFTTTGGVLVRPAAGITATMTINNSRLQNNDNIAVRLDTVGIVGSAINATIDSSVVSGNTNGVLAKSSPSSGVIKLMINRTLFDDNSGVGLISNGSASNVRISNSVISNNGTGVSLLSSANLTSYGNNVFDGNTTDGGFTATSLRTE